MTIALVSSGKTTGGQHGGSLNLDCTNASIVFASTCQDGSTTRATPTLGGVNFTGLTEKLDGNGACYTRLWYFKSPPSGVQAIALSAVGNIFSGICAAAFSGVDTTAPFDGNEASASAGSGTQTSGAVTPGQNDSIVVAACGFNTGSAPTAGGAFTIASNNSYAFGGGNNYGCGLAYSIQSGSPVSANCTFTITGNGGSAGVDGCFKPSTGTTTNQSAAASTSPVSSVSRSTGKPVAASTSPAGSVRKAVGKPVAASTSPAATLTSLKVRLLSIDASTAPVASVATLRSNGVIASTSPVATLTKVVNRAIAAATSPVATAAKQIPKTIAASTHPVARVLGVRNYVAVLNGSNGFTRAQCAALQTPPFWYCGRASITEVAGGAAMTFLAAAKTDMSMGSWLKTFYPRPAVYVADGTSSSSATSQEALIPRPYWDHIGASVISATDRRVLINGTEDLGGTITGGTSRVIGDISGGKTRIGIDCAGSNGMTGRTGQWLAGTGTPTDADWALLKAFDGTNLPALSAGVTVTNYWPLDGDGRDLIGGEDMANVGTPTYAIDTMASPTPVTARQQLITEIHTNDVIYPDLPTCITGDTPPLDTSGYSNYLRTDSLDCLVHFGALAFKARVYLFVPTAGNGHTVLFHGGHQDQTDWAADTYGTKTVIGDLVAAGYQVAGGFFPGYDATWNSFNNTALGVTASDHNALFGVLQDATHNPWEIIVAGLQCALNYIKANSPASAAKVSFLGLSGGANVGAVMMAMDPRINHAGLFFRGTIAARRRVDTNMDGEQYPNATYWEQNQFHRFCGTSNRRVYLVFHPGDGIIGSNSYLNANLTPTSTSYDYKFLAPIRAANPYADVQIKLSTGSSTHSLYHADSVDTILPALSTALTSLSRGAGAHLGLRLGLGL